MNETICVLCKVTINHSVSNKKCHIDQISDKFTRCHIHILPFAFEILPFFLLQMCRTHNVFRAYCFASSSIGQFPQDKVSHRPHTTTTNGLEVLIIRLPIESLLNHSNLTAEQNANAEKCKMFVNAYGWTRRSSSSHRKKEKTVHSWCFHTVKVLSPFFYIFLHSTSCVRNLVSVAWLPSVQILIRHVDHKTQGKLFMYAN